MIVQGGLDFRVSYEQGQEAFQAAKLKGLKAKMVYFLMKTTGYFIRIMPLYGSASSSDG